MRLRIVFPAGLLLAVAQTLAAPPPEPSGEQILGRVNARPLGQTEIRHARMTLVSGEKAVNHYEVVTARRMTAGNAATLFVLQSPKALSGTSFLLEESTPPGTDRCRTWLFLPAGERRVLEIPPAQLSDFILGSDFTYQDWRVWLPLRDLRVLQSQKAACSTGPCYRLLVEPRSVAAARGLGWDRARIEVDERTWSVSHIEYFRGSSKFPIRLFSALDLHSFRGVWTPQRMVMTTLPARDQTVIDLLGAWYDENLGADLFDPKRLPMAAGILNRRYGDRFTAGNPSSP